MRTVTLTRFVLLPAVVCLALSLLIGCGSSGTPAAAPAAAPAKAVSIFDLAAAFEADAAKATADYASQTIKVTDLLAGSFWDMTDEGEGKYLTCSPYNATKNEGNTGSDCYLGDKKITDVAFPYPVQFNVEDEKILESLNLSKQETVEGVVRRIYSDKIEVECELAPFNGDDLRFKTLKIIKK
ncbi:MAG: hypothetical protein KKB51_03705 [Candidatus Riflebacteria bacterium]|nr:hypothetical protein [Candidatus Riflebacteria bacterium]